MHLIQTSTWEQRLMENYFLKVADVFFNTKLHLTYNILTESQPSGLSNIKKFQMQIFNIVIAAYYDQSIFLTPSSMSLVLRMLHVAVPSVVLCSARWTDSDWSGVATPAAQHLISWRHGHFGHYGQAQPVISTLGSNYLAVVSTIYQ